MTGSARENWVKALLPAAVVVLVYTLLIYLSQQRQIKALREELRDTERSAVTEDDLWVVHQRLSQARTSLADAEQACNEAQQQLDQELVVFRRRPDPALMLQLDRICHDLSLSLLSQQSINEVEMSEQRKTAIRELRRMLGEKPVEFRCLRVSGQYTGIVQLLERLPREIPRYVPLAVELVERGDAQAGAAGSSHRQWKIYFLM